MNAITAAANPLGCSAEEWRTRVDLAAAYRMQARYRLTDMADGYIAARVPGEPDSMLLRGYGDFPEIVRASRLYKRSLSRRPAVEKLDGPDYAAITMTQAILNARADLACVIHAHTKATMVIAGLQSAILPVSQAGIMFSGDRAVYLDFCYNVEEPEHCAQLAEVLVAPCKVIVLRNHGVIVCGSTVAEAIKLLYYFDQACALQVEMLKTGAPLALLEGPRVDEWRRLYWEDTSTVEMNGTREWRSILELLDRDEPDYRT